MRFRILGCVLTAAALFGCKIENDMMVPKDVAGFEAFEIEDNNPHPSTPPNLQ